MRSFSEGFLLPESAPVVIEPTSATPPAAINTTADSAKQGGDVEEAAFFIRRVRSFDEAVPPAAPMEGAAGEGKWVWPWGELPSKSNASQAAAVTVNSKALRPPSGTENDSTEILGATDVAAAAVPDGESNLTTGSINYEDISDFPMLASRCAEILAGPSSPSNPSELRTTLLLHRCAYSIEELIASGGDSTTYSNLVFVYNDTLLTGAVVAHFLSMSSESNQISPIEWDSYVPNTIAAIQAESASRPHWLGRKVSSWGVMEERKTWKDEDGSNLHVCFNEDLWDDDGTDEESFSLNEVLATEISPEPALGDLYDSDTDSYSIEDSVVTSTRSARYRYRKSLIPSQEQLKSLPLVAGENSLSFELEGHVSLSAKIFLWPQNARVIVSGTRCRKSEYNVFSFTSVLFLDVEGIVLTADRKSWGGLLASSLTTPNPSAIELLAKLHTKGYRVLFFLSKSLSMIEMQRLRHTLRGSAGPILRSPDSLVRAFGDGSSEIFKAAALRGIRSLFPSHHCPFYAAFCCKEADAEVCARSAIPESRVYHMSNKGLLLSLHRVEFRSFGSLLEEANVLFPSPHPRAPSVDESFNDFQYWRRPLYLIE